MITEKELTEYRSLCATLGELRGTYRRRKQELRRLLEETGALRREALHALVKANRLTRHLTGRQRQITGLTYHLGEIRARMNQGSQALFQGSGEEGETLSGRGNLQSSDWQSSDWQVPDWQSHDCNSGRELRQRGLLILRMIDNIRKKLLQLELVELRCRELMLSVNKAMEAFRHESRIIRRKIYPFGILSLLYRTLRRLLGGSYFSHPDMEDVAALGAISVCVLKIADSPVI